MAEERAQLRAGVGQRLRQRDHLVEADDLAMGLDQHRFIETLAAAEVVVHGGQGRAGALADLLAGAAGEAALREDPAGGLQQMQTGRRPVGARRARCGGTSLLSCGRCHDVNGPFRS